MMNVFHSLLHTASCPLQVIQSDLTVSWQSSFLVVSLHMSYTSEPMNCEWKAELNDMTSMSSLETVVVGCLFGEIKGSNEYGMIEPDLSC